MKITGIVSWDLLLYCERLEKLLTSLKIQEMNRKKAFLELLTLFPGVGIFSKYPSVLWETLPYH
jgi:hypothetical protein